ncbi:MAG: hypothetical protein ACOCWG_01410, partial [bacterium]
NLNPIVPGDGVEYVFMQESWNNHFSPDIRTEDLNSSLKILQKNDIYDPYGYLTGLKGFFKESKDPLSQYWGVFKSYSGKHYCYHFWFYSLLNVPARKILSFFHFNELKSFQITNILLLILVLIYIISGSKLNELEKFLAIILFTISANLWYLRWPHPEVFSSVTLFFSILFLHDRRYLFSILIAAIGSFQNPPIAFIIPFVILKYYMDNGFDIKKILLLSLTGLTCLYPSIFYYFHFKVPNLIIYSSYVNKDFLNIRRFSSLFFDLNQGMIISLPIILPVFIIIVLQKLVHVRKLSFNMFYPLLLIAMAIPSIQQANWNMGESVIVRYALWLSVIIMFYFIKEFNWYLLKNKVLMTLVIISQIIIVSIYEIHNPKLWKYVELNKVSKFIFTNFPALYNPEPEIFAERVLNREGVSEDESPIIFYGKDNVPTKILIHESNFEEKISEILPGVQKKDLKFRYGWAYINLK